MKATFVARTGKGSGPSVADEIEQRLASANLLPSHRKLPRSTLNRLLSAEPFRNRVGISMKAGRFEFTHDETTTLGALARIASDLASREVVLGHLWDVDGKEAYLNRLDSEGVLPGPSHALATGGNQKDTPKQPKTKPTAKAVPTIRSTLIPPKDFGLSWPGRLQRHHQIWEELQFHLNLKKHPNAVSVLLRVLLELALDNYIKAATVPVHENDKLAMRLEKVGQHLLAAGQINSKQMDVIRKFKQGDKLVSADTLNRYVHSPNFAPSPEHLSSMWDSLADVIVLCLKT